MTTRFNDFSTTTNNSTMNAIRCNHLYLIGRLYGEDAAYSINTILYGMPGLNISDLATEFNTKFKNMKNQLPKFIEWLINDKHFRPVEAYTVSGIDEDNKSWWSQYTVNK